VPTDMPRTTISGARVIDSQAQPGRCILHVVFPREVERVFRLRESETVVGRDPGLDGLLLDHGTISRRHAAVTWNPAQRSHAVRDLDSRNGTRVDGVSALSDAPRSLVNGSVLRLGDTLLVYEHDTGSDDEDESRISRDAVPGKAANIRHLRALIARAASDPAAVLIQGDTGTGKERIAREIHRLSGRSGKLVALNCAALGAQIVETQLFGHVKGAFTGATDAQPGLFRAAHGGTLFLDEIGDLPLEIQPKLLRALQEGEVLPVGATQTVKVDVRVVAATHRDLTRAMHDHTFREDLYARLSTWELRVPPIRERRVDLLGWIDRLHAAWTARRDTAGTLRFDADAAEALLRFDWALNLRAVDRLVHELAAAPGANTVFGRSALPAWLGAGTAGSAPAPEVVAPPSASSASGPVRSNRDALPTRDEFKSAFEELGGSVRALAKRFGRDRRQIYRWLETYGLAERRPGATRDDT
jgi:transcriptional regulator with GAF, ATPase, and Fis domain